MRPRSRGQILVPGDGALCNKSLNMWQWFWDQLENGSWKGLLKTVMDAWRSLTGGLQGK